MATEQQAYSLYCPARLAAGKVSRCQGAYCMAWRWGEHQPPRQRIYCPDRYATVEEGMVRPARALNWEFAPWEGVAGLLRSDYPAQWLEPQAEHLARCEGYCGLAGKP